MYIGVWVLVEEKIDVGISLNSFHLTLLRVKII